MNKIQLTALASALSLGLAAGTQAGSFTSATQVVQDGDQKTKKEQDKKADLVTVYILDAAGKG